MKRTVREGVFLLAASLASCFARGEQAGDYTFVIDGGQATITRFNTAYEGALVVTNSLGGYPVKTIGTDSFFNCSRLTRVEVGDLVTAIWHRAFLSCTNLAKVSAGRNVVLVGNFAFAHCPVLRGILFAGDCPRYLGGDLFGSSPPDLTVYYLPGRVGWGATFYSRSTLLWNPRVQAGPDFGFVEGRFGFSITGSTNIPILVEGSTHLAGGGWCPLATNILDEAGAASFSDPSSEGVAARFYRIVWP